jgi:hypothetical protein
MGSRVFRLVRATVADFREEALASGNCGAAKKIKEDPGVPEYLLSIRGVGNRFDG